MPQGCASLESYQQLALGSAPDSDAAALEEHLLECPACVLTVRALTTEDRLAATLRSRVRSLPPPDLAHVDTLIRRLLTHLPASQLLTAATLDASGQAVATPAD